MAKKKDLLIVESPTKAHTIGLLLKGRMKVLSSRGHIADLPKSRLGVDVDRGFEPEYIRIRGKAPVINELRKAARSAGTVFLGCDPDREGEAIAFSVANEIGTGAPVRRVLFYEITKKGLAEAFAAPTAIDENKVDSHRARRVLDRLVGYLVSPLLWKIVKGGLSAGRVQTVALRLIVEREREIQAFRPEEYWVVKAVFVRSTGERFEAMLARIGDEPAKLTNAADVEKVRAACREADFAVSEVKARERRRKPLPPFITATLQQDAAQRLGFPARRTMRAAQELFEGIRLADETAGLITYPRTDSFRVAAESIDETRQLVLKQFGREFLPEKPRHYPDRKGTQGAHEAIRPTRLDLTPEKVHKHLTPDQLKVYDLIYRRFVASQMADSVYALSEVFVTGGGCAFKADAIRCRFPGFEKMYGDPEKEKELPTLIEGEAVKLAEFAPEQKFTQPPARYSEATLIKRLETNGIGRPSTYAAIVSTLLERKYVERREGRFHPTELGTVVYDIVIPGFANVFEVGFTAEMERELDLVEAGKERWRDVVARFYTPFKEDLDKMKKGAADIREDLKTELDEKCPKCGAGLVERWGRYGKFTACSRYPECDYVKRPPAKLLEEKCPECGKPLAERTGRFGMFVACSGYPDCKFIRKTPRPEPKPLDEKCPKCGERLALREGRFGLFVACSTYPKCRFVKRDARPEPKPLDEKCPECGRQLVERTGRFGTFIGCSGYPQCKYIKKEPGDGRTRRKERTVTKNEPAE
uniref:DNA topoisomerase 1 n=1 Tax=candidate division WOR-3 bacterium TaxID=2052148 RepID=A0A7C4CAH8_UNCW3